MSAAVCKPVAQLNEQEIGDWPLELRGKNGQSVGGLLKKKSSLLKNYLPSSFLGHSHEGHGAQ